ncbi:MAG: hypothetical protein M3296_06770 [Actinomycetota bacterium]|nr:hypothetical protein [Actinomycetota bacterium]
MVQLRDDTRQLLDLGRELTVEVVGTDESAARRSLRAQVARLERELSACCVSPFGQAALDGSLSAAGGPRLLTLAELEQLRDDLLERLRGTRAAVADRGEREEANRLLLERMRADPRGHRYVRVTRADVGSEAAEAGTCARGWGSWAC